MKDALGHGSEARGGGRFDETYGLKGGTPIGAPARPGATLNAAHGTGVDQVGRPQTWYHGSPKAADIQKYGFSPDIGKGSGYRGVLGTGVNVTDNKDHAAQYGKVLNVEISPGLKMFETNNMVRDVYNEHTNYCVSPSCTAILSRPCVTTLAARSETRHADGRPLASFGPIRTFSTPCFSTRPQIIRYGPHPAPSTF